MKAMDYARKIGKSTEPKKWIKAPPAVATIRDPPITPDTVFVEDRRLTNWKTWLTNRKNQYRHINLKTGRHQTEQVMNSCETVRPIIEMHNLMEHAMVPVPAPPDKYRGGPEFWRIPPPIPKWSSSLPDITFAPSRKDLNLDPELTYVGLPKLIQKEKDLVGLFPSTPSYKRSRYLIKRKEQLAQEIETLAPTEPDMKHLVIKNVVPPRKFQPPRIPPISISHVEEDAQICDFTEQVVVLKIQDKELRRTFSPSGDEEMNSEPLAWHLVFSSKVNQMQEKEIVFENKGNRVIVYQWRDVRFRSKSMPIRRRLSPFFFNKTKSVILPGQFARLKIWYRPRKAGIFVEHWRLLTDPELCSTPLLFRFSGFAETMRTVEEETARAVDVYLDHRIRDYAIRELIEEIIEDIGYQRLPDPAYGKLFLESDIFTAKNPMCYYQPSLVVEFHKIYQNVTNQTETRWNLSINDLRDVLLMIEQPERRQSMLKQLSELYKECLKPTTYTSIRPDKHEMVYNLLCQCANRFETESEYAGCVCLGRSQEGVREISTIYSRKLTSAWIDEKNRGESIPVLTSDRILECNKDPTKTMKSAMYRETFFVRIYMLLGETMEQIFSTIDSYNNLNSGDK